jgi:hypothetical protein
MCTLRAIVGRHHVLWPFAVFRRTDVDECGPCIWVAPSSGRSFLKYKRLFVPSLAQRQHTIQRQHAIRRAHTAQLNILTQLFTLLTQQRDTPDTTPDRTLNMSSVAGAPPPPPFRNSLRRPEEASVPTPLKLRVPRSSMIQ